ncbi:nuclear transport factor 2 family protein [Rhodococcoides yunnanense]|uniref:Nuclear transport factor 2 family protein n=1 Tax=Rhodococcoides yunnanense TaxID=278209 RepID=A0ABU4BK70_9NOCA|nr:nuclear transport factor 2 family protein [Rhodococcus yunnanensis]MDV6264617.1 nuclear transport factor 2 family protein [Rhodococcus yunnanensis]
MHDLGIQFFIRLESCVWDALANGDADADLELLSADFVGVYPTGFANRADHANQLADGPSIASYSISEAKLIDVSRDAAMLCYRADYLRPHRSVGESMFISSLWLQRDGRWQNKFSQDSPVTS